MAPRCLRSITTEYPAGVAMQERKVHNLFKSLEANCDSTVLASISLVQNITFLHDDPNFEDDDWEYTIDTFEPLLSFRNLHTLGLSLVAIHYGLDNLSIERMAAAWPLMQRFELNSEVGSGADVEPHITLDGLLPMARYWPQLESLSLSFDAVTGKIPLEKPGGGNQCPLLTVLDVGYSGVTSSKGKVAAFLTDIFPNLVEIHSSFDCDEWEDIAEIAYAMGRAREQERLWAGEKGKGTFLIVNLLDFHNAQK